MKNAFKLILAAVFLASPAFAAPENSEIPEYKYAKECYVAALPKLKALAETKQAVLVEESVGVSGIDDRWYNPSKYIWFSGEAKLANGEVIVVQTLTQKYVLSAKKCF